MLRKIFLIIIIVVIVAIGLFLNKNMHLFPIIYELIFTEDIVLKKSMNKVNILLLGSAGGVHDGPNLTDSIIFVSLNSDTQTATLASIPRDLWIADLKQKINTAYTIGESEKKNGGLLFAKAVVSRVIGQEIDYSLRIDFNGFIKAIDLIGGLDVNIENAFDDFEYPIEENRENLCDHSLEEATNLLILLPPVDVFPCRYKKIHFNKGILHMNGAMALTYVRSRHAIGIEGSDFARSNRQLKIITAFKDKIFSSETILSPTKIVRLYSLIKESIDTDIDQSEFADFIKLANEMRKAKIRSFVIDYSDEKHNGLLINPPIYKYGQWVLIPRLGEDNFIEINSYISCIISGKICLIPPIYEKH